MKNKLVNNRIHRGVLILQEYGFEMCYIAGKFNVVADALSRDNKNKIVACSKVHIGRGKHYDGSRRIIFFK